MLTAQVLANYIVLLLQRPGGSEKIHSSKFSV